MAVDQHRVGRWDLYDALTGPVPASSVVRCYLLGQGWTVAEAAGDDGAGMGLAMTFPRPPGTGQHLRASLAGRPLREVAQGLRSWDLSIAAIGMAAVNAHYNRRERLEDLLGRSLTASMPEPVFAAMADEIAGRKVAVEGLSRAWSGWPPAAS